MNPRGQIIPVRKHENPSFGWHPDAPLAPMSSMYHEVRIDTEKLQRYVCRQLDMRQYRTEKVLHDPLILLGRDCVDECGIVIPEGLHLQNLDLRLGKYQYAEVRLIGSIEGVAIIDRELYIGSPRLTINKNTHKAVFENETEDKVDLVIRTKS